jgi:membrane fusion protein (multidrug efflux system)
MSAIEKPVLTPAVTAPAPVPAAQQEHAPAPPARPKLHCDDPHFVEPVGRWRKYATPALVLLLAAALVITIARNWNAWQGGRIEQVTDDAYVQGDLTPLSTRVAGIVKDVKVSDYQKVHKGDLLVQLEDDDYLAQVAQTTAAVEAANATIQNNRPQQELQDARIARALAGIDQANAQIGAAQDAREAVQAAVVRTQKERHRQEALLLTSSSTPQRVEQAVADQQRYAAQLASQEADLDRQ